MLAGTTGDPASEETFLGPLADKAQTDNVLAFFEQGKKDGVEFVGAESKRSLSNVQMGFPIFPDAIFDGVPGGLARVV